MAPPPRELVLDVVSEILLRLPPDEPECLFRAALVCKPWLRIISDPAFLSHYRAFHGTPPLLGLIDADHKFGIGGSWSFRIVSTRAAPAFPFRWPDAHCGRPLDCRHGRVLTQGFEDGCVYYYVCDYVTGVHYLLPQTKIRHARTRPVCTAAAVFCAAPGCKHLDCHGGPFCVVLMINDLLTGTIVAQFYSSEIGAWSKTATNQGICDRHLYGRGALIGDEIYFMFSVPGSAGIIKYDWGKNCLSLVNPLPPSVYPYGFTLMVMEDCSLGLAEIKFSSLSLWSRRVSSEGTTEWVQCRVIDLEKLMPMANPYDYAAAVGFAEGVDVIFVKRLVGLFMMELKSGRVRKLHKPNCSPCFSVLPYMGFYTPDRSRLSR